VPAIQVSASPSFFCLLCTYRVKLSWSVSWEPIRQSEARSNTGPIFFIRILFLAHFKYIPQNVDYFLLFPSFLSNVWNSFPREIGDSSEKIYTPDLRHWPRERLRNFSLDFSENCFHSPGKPDGQLQWVAVLCTDSRNSINTDGPDNWISGYPKIRICRRHPVHPYFLVPRLNTTVYLESSTFPCSTGQSKTFETKRQVWFFCSPILFLQIVFFL